LYSLPSLRMKTFITSPGSTTGLSEVGELVDVENLDAAQLRHFIEVEVVGDNLALQASRARLDQLEDRLRAPPGNRRRRSSPRCPTSSESSAGCRGPRRPRLRFSESAESATSCSSFRTNCGNDEGAVDKSRFSQTSAMRPSMITLVSRIRYRARWVRPRRNRLMRRAGSSHSPCLAPITRAQVRQGDQDEAVQKLDPRVAGVRPEQARANGPCQNPARWRCR